MKLDPSIHIVMHLVSSLKWGVTHLLLKLLTFNSRTVLLPTCNKHQAKTYKKTHKGSTTKSREPTKRKALKEHSKGYRARSYYRESVRNPENEAKVEKMIHLSEDLYYNRKETIS